MPAGCKGRRKGLKNEQNRPRLLKNQAVPSKAGRWAGLRRGVFQQPVSAWQERKDELAKLYADGPTVHQPNLKVYKNEFSAVGNYYNAGCPRESFSKFILEILKIPGQTVQETQDVTNWFQEYEIKMQGTVTMRKTDNGWRALSEG